MPGRGLSGQAEVTDKAKYRPLTTAYLLAVAATQQPTLLAEKLDHIGRGGARLAEGDPAVTAQSEFLAAQDDLAVALDGDVGAVGAVVAEDELVEPTLDLAVRARRHALADHHIRGRIAAKRDRGLLLRA